MNNLLMRYVFDRKHTATETEKGLLQIEVRISGTVKAIQIFHTILVTTDNKVIYIYQTALWVLPL